MEKSEQIGELAAALAKAQGEMKNAAFDKINPHFKSKYASLASVRDAITPSLSKNGLSVSQLCSRDNVETILMHSSGQYISCSTPIICAQNCTPQAFGSALTYAKRYGLSSICGISSDDDDDGNAAEQETKKRQSKPENIEIKHDKDDVVYRSIDELIKQGEESASKGKASFAKWCRTLSPKDIDDTREYGDRWKKMAHDVDSLNVKGGE